MKSQIEPANLVTQYAIEKIAEVWSMEKERRYLENLGICPIAILNNLVQNHFLCH